MCILRLLFLGLLVLNQKFLFEMNVFFKCSGKKWLLRCPLWQVSSPSKSGSSVKVSILRRYLH